MRLNILIVTALLGTVRAQTIPTFPVNPAPAPAVHKDKPKAAPTSTIRVTVDAYCNLYLDGVQKAFSGPEDVQTFNLEKGEHQLKVTSTNYTDVSLVQVFQVNPDEGSKFISLQLKEKIRQFKRELDSSKVSFQVQPDVAAYIYIDAENMGKLEKDEIKTFKLFKGKHRIKAVAFEYKSAFDEQEPDLEPGPGILIPFHLQDKLVKQVKNLSWSGCTYSGNTKSGVPDGQGEEKGVNSEGYEFTYTGNFSNGKYDGRGIIVYGNGNRYEGEWKDDNFSGKGVFYWASGQKYDGEWKYNNMEGQGTYTWPNGTRYEGEWKDGRKHGQGTFYYADHSRFTGQWVDGRKEGPGTLFYPDGSKLEGIWRNDVKTDAK